MLIVSPKVGETSIGEEETKHLWRVRGRPLGAISRPDRYRVV